MKHTLSLDRLTRMDDCEAALKFACREQKTLLWKKLGLELQIERRLDKLAALERTLGVKKMEASIAGGTASQIPETSPMYKKYTDDRVRLEWELAMLEIRIKALKPSWLLEKELRLQCIEAALQQVSLLILELEAHKLVLQKQASQELAVDYQPPLPVVDAPTGKRKPASPPVSRLPPPTSAGRRRASWLVDAPAGRVEGFWTG